MTSNKFSLNPESMPGIIFHKILSDLVSKSNSEITSALVEMGINKEAKDVSGALLSLCKRGLIRRKKVDGFFMYIKPVSKSPSIRNEISKTQAKEKHTQRTSRGTDMAKTIKFFSENIGQPIALRDLFQATDIKNNSSVHVRLNKLVDMGFLNKTENPYGRGFLYTALPNIVDFGKPGTRLSPAMSDQNALPPDFPAPPHLRQSASTGNIVPNNQHPNLVNIFQQVLEQQTQNEQYRNAFIQIAGILENIGIIEGV